MFIFGGVTIIVELLFKLLVLGIDVVTGILFYLLFFLIGKIS